jgi:hypothetical protein
LSNDEGDRVLNDYQRMLEHLDRNFQLMKPKQMTDSSNHYSEQFSEESVGPGYPKSVNALH